MKKKRFSEEQISGIIRQAEPGDQTIGEICPAHGMSEQTFTAGAKSSGGRSPKKALSLFCRVFTLLSG